MPDESSLEEALTLIRDLDVSEIADAIQTVGFECTRCGACCRGDAGEEHTATIFPDEVRRLSRDTDAEWRDVARPIPWGLDDSGHGMTIEWALQTGDCGDCTFLKEHDDGRTACGVYDDRPMICRTYPFTLALSPESAPLGEAVDHVGPLVIHECEGVGRAIEREEAMRLARQLKRRGVRATREAIDVREQLAGDLPDEPTVVVDSEGYKTPTGEPIDPDVANDRPLNGG